MSGIGDSPGLVMPGVDWSTVDQEDIKLTAKQMKLENPDLSEEDITAWLSFLKEHNEKLTTEHYNKLLAGEPALTKQEIKGVAFRNFSKIVESNPWLGPNATTMFTIAFMELAYKLSDIKMGEAKVAIGAIQLMMEMAENISDLIMKIAKLEARMHYAKAAAAGISGAASAFGGWRGAKQKESGHAMAVSQKWSSIGKIGEVGSEIYQGVITLQKGRKEAIKQIIEATMRIQEKMLDQALGAYKSKDDEIGQILQKLTQIISEAYKAHSLRAG